MTSPTQETPALLCPACGFDLRATPSDRCSECGLAFDRALLTVSGIPWAHRRTMGRVRAYFKTFWQITLDSKSIRYEAAKPQLLSDARSFRRINACIVAAAFLTAFATAAYMQGGLLFLAIQPPDPFSALGIGTKGPTHGASLYDLAVPWSAGATIVPVMPICLILLAFWISGAQRFLFRLPASSSPTQKQRALCLSHYAAAPLVFLPVVVLLLVSDIWITGALHLDGTRRLAGAELGFIIVTTSVFLLSILATFLRTGKWLVRTRQCGLLAATLALAELLGLWLLGAFVLLGLFPWFIGFLWITIDSLR